MVSALTFVGSPDEEAMATATGLIEAAEETRNPYMLSLALRAFGDATATEGPEGPPRNHTPPTPLTSPVLVNPCPVGGAIPHGGPCYVVVVKPQPQEAEPGNCHDLCADVDPCPVSGVVLGTACWVMVVTAPMKRFRTPGGAQRFLAVFSVISPHFRPRRHRLTADDYRTEMTRRFVVWNEVTGLTAVA